METEKIMCFDRPNSDGLNTALLTALTANKGATPMEAAAMMNGGGFGGGYEGMPFMRWLSDTIGKNIHVEWSKFL